MTRRWPVIFRPWATQRRSMRDSMYSPGPRVRPGWRTMARSLRDAVPRAGLAEGGGRCHYVVGRAAADDAASPDTGRADRPVAARVPSLQPARRPSRCAKRTCTISVDMEQEVAASASAGNLFAVYGVVDGNFSAMDCPYTGEVPTDGSYTDARGAPDLPGHQRHPHRQHLSLSVRHGDCLQLRRPLRRLRAVNLSHDRDESRGAGTAPRPFFNPLGLRHHPALCCKPPWKTPAPTTAS